MNSKDFLDQRGCQTIFHIGIVNRKYNCEDLVKKQTNKQEKRVICDSQNSKQCCFPFGTFYLNSRHSPNSSLTPWRRRTVSRAKTKVPMTSQTSMLKIIAWLKRLILRSRRAWSSSAFLCAGGGGVQASTDVPFFPRAPPEEPPPPSGLARGALETSASSLSRSFFTYAHRKDRLA